MKLNFIVILFLQSVYIVGATVLFATTPLGKAYYWNTDKEKLQVLDQIETKTITSTFDGLYAVDKYGKFYSKRTLDEEKWDQTRLKINKKSVTFDKLTAVGDQHIYGLTKKGNIYRCSKHFDCTKGENWSSAPEPERKELEQSGLSQKINMKKKVEGVLTEIAAQNHKVYGLCKTGALFELQNDEWKKIELKFKLKSINICGNTENLFVVTEKGDILTQTNQQLSTNSHDSASSSFSWTSVYNDPDGGGNDFEKVVVVDENVWAVNYYKQLFRLDKEGWTFIHWDIDQIFGGDYPSTRRNFRPRHDEL